MRYRLGAERGRGPVEVRVEIERWREIEQQWIPLSIVRYEDGAPAASLQIQDVRVSPGVEDGSFDSP